MHKDKCPKSSEEYDENTLGEAERGDVCSYSIQVKMPQNKKMRREMLQPTHCEPWESARERNDHQVPGARISAGGWMQS